MSEFFKQVKYDGNVEKFKGFDATQVTFPKIALERPLHKITKGCLSEVVEILTGICGSGNEPLMIDFIHFLETWEGEFDNFDCFVEEMIDLFFYTVSVLNNLPQDKVQQTFDAVIEKNYKRGYYTTQEYKRDSERGY